MNNLQCPTLKAYHEKTSLASHTALTPLEGVPCAPIHAPIPPTLFPQRYTLFLPCATRSLACYIAHQKSRFLPHEKNFGATYSLSPTAESKSIILLLHF
jgi:hypothetical protein